MSQVSHEGAISRATIRNVAVPIEHGGWAFLLQPMVLGLLIAPSWAGLGLALAALCAFLAHQPLKIALGDWRRHKVYPRTGLAWRFVAGYGALACLAAAWVVASAPAPLFWLPLVMGLPFALTQLVLDARKQSREAVAEIAGALALGSLAPALAVLGGWDVARALPLWPLLACQAVPAILYARARLRLERGQIAGTAAYGTGTTTNATGLTPNDTRRAPGTGTAGIVQATTRGARRRAPTLAHVAGLLVAIGLAWATGTPWLAVVAMGIMLARAVLGLSKYRKPARAAQVGMQEVLFSALYLAFTLAGYALGL